MVYRILLIVHGKKLSLFLIFTMKKHSQLPAYTNFHSIHMHKLVKKLSQLWSHPRQTLMFFTANNKHYTLLIILRLLQGYYNHVTSWNKVENLTNPFCFQCCSNLVSNKVANKVLYSIVYTGPYAYGRPIWVYMHEHACSYA